MRNILTLSPWIPHKMPETWELWMCGFVLCTGHLWRVAPGWWMRQIWYWLEVYHIGGDGQGHTGQTPWSPQRIFTWLPFLSASWLQKNQSQITAGRNALMFCKGATTVTYSHGSLRASLRDQRWYMTFVRSWLPHKNTISLWPELFITVIPGVNN